MIKVQMPMKPRVYKIAWSNPKYFFTIQTFTNKIC